MSLKLVNEPKEKIFLVHIWSEDGSKFSSEGKFKNSHDFKISENFSSRKCIVLLETSNKGRFFLGNWNAKAGHFKKPTLNSEDVDVVEVEQSALNRIKEQLTLKVGLKFRIRSDKAHIEAKNIKSMIAKNSNLFFLECDENNFIDREIIDTSFEISGMSYSFRSKIVEKDGNRIAAYLPSSVCRSVVRRIPRKLLKKTIKINSEFTAEIIDFSVCGCKLKSNLINNIDVLDFVLLNIKINNTEIEIPSFIVSIENNELHCVFDLSSCENSKYIFYNILNEMIDDFYIHENPNDAWSCLANFGYTQLDKSGNMSEIEKDCKLAWRYSLNSNKHFHPVVYKNKIPLGTIAATKVDNEHWIPNALSVKVDPKNVIVTELLYTSWPSYIQSVGHWGWISTWYDSNKKWHNRFYKTFIKENENSKHLSVFDRHWYWISNLKNGANKKVYKYVDFEMLSKKQKSELIPIWEKRYCHLEKTNPYKKLNKRVYFEFLNTSSFVFCKDEFIGVIQFITSKYEFNPASVFRVGHISIFSDRFKKDKKIINNLISDIKYFFRETEAKRASITFDFDIDINLIVDDDLSYFAVTTCLCTTPFLLPSLVSNNLLSFADIRLRKNEI